MLPILNQSLWRDEAFSALMAIKSPLQIISLSAQDQTPPLFELLLHYWMMLFGKTETALRGLPFLFHLGTAGVMFFLIQKLTKSNKAAFLVSLATLLNPFLLEYAFEARTYTLLAFLTLLTVLCVAYKKYIFASIALSLALLSHNFAIFVVLAVGCWFVYIKQKHVLSYWKEILQLFFLPAITFVGWGFVLWNQWVRLAHGFWIKPPTSVIFLQTFQKFATSDLGYSTSGFLYVISFLLVLVGFTYWMWKAKEETSSTLSLLGFLVGVPIVVVYAISLLFAPVYLERYLIEILPPFIALIGFSLWSFLKENPSKKIFITVICTAYFLLLFQMSEQLLQSTSKPAINWTVGQILSQAKPGDVIIPKDVLNFLETKWYVKEAGSSIPVYAYAPKMAIPFYIGAILFEPQEVIKKMPAGKRIWEVEPDGGYKLLTTR